MGPQRPEPFWRHPVLAPRPLAPRTPRSGSTIAFDAGQNTTRRIEENEVSGITDARPAKRTRVACRRCRRSKLRCEASSGSSQSCQRCADLDQPCVFDERFKRASKKTALRDAADQVDPPKTCGDISSRDSYPPSATPTASTSFTQTGSLMTSEPVEAQQMSESNHSPELISPRHLSERRATSGDMSVSNLRPSNSQRASVTRQIESVKLSPGQIDLYFHIYYSYYHTALPMLPPSVSPDAVYKASPVLFWTIIATAARHDCADFSLLPSLLPAVKGLLWTTIAAAPHALPSLQAMTLLCLWTFPVSTMPEDITYILAGLLKSAAIHVGLHRPDILELYSRSRAPLGKAELLQAVRVWCCIYLAVEGASLGNGHLPVLPHDRTVQKVASEPNPYELPEPLYIAIITQLFLNKIHSTFGNLEGSYKVSMLSIFEPDLRELEVKIAAYQSLS